MRDCISIHGARTNNLKNISLDIPRDKLVVFTGLSGSGKSSLAFDTIYAEGQRRYVESLSSYARQFLGQMEKPDVDYIDGLSPAISIDQKTTSRNPRSTVGTVTEIYDYLRLLWSRVGIPHCPNCGKEIRKQTIDQIVDRLLLLPEGSRIQIMAPIVRGRKGEYSKEFAEARKSGFVRCRVDGILYDLSEEIKLKKTLKHNIDIVVDRLVIRGDITRRLTDSAETAAALSGGIITVNLPEKEEDLTFSQNYACEDCGISIEELPPRMFSFNNPLGACPECDGIGAKMLVDPELLIPNMSLTIREGAIVGPQWGNIKSDTIAKMYFDALAKRYHFDFDTPMEKLPKDALNAILYGTDGEKLEIQYEREKGYSTFYQPFEGIVNNLKRRYRETQSSAVRAELEQYMSECTCSACGGRRLKDIVLAVTVGGKSISEFTEMSVTEELDFIEGLKLEGKAAMIADSILKEIRARLSFLKNVGLEYLNLSRQAGTLSGGEAQRIRLATQIGSSLMGVLYILDEPSIGLHQRDNGKLLSTLKRLRDLGNTLIVVEHDEETMREADYIVDIGPGAGSFGGEVVCSGTPEEIMACEGSVTGQYLSGRKRIPVPETRRAGNGHWLELYGAQENNLKNIDVRLPLGAFTCVTGVSGSGKSSLVNQILYKAMAARLNRVRCHPGKYRELKGLEWLDKVICIDQAPIGRTPRSNPATYTGLFGDIRELYADTPDARARGYTPGRFSFNVRGGRCEACSGDGLLKIEMQFLPDIYVPCEVCKGKRYNRETLEVRFKGKSIYDILEMTVDEALLFFDNQPKIRTKIQALRDVGLGYVKLGQNSTELSGGEAQRVKLASELLRPATGRTVYILDEPTTGLHTADVHMLLEALNRLIEAGNTVIVIEHNLDVIKSADYILDLGPEGGDRGGTLVCCGTPEEVAAVEESYTGQWLKQSLGQ